MPLFFFVIFHTVLLPERFADHRSAFTFGTHLWDSPEGHPVTVPSVFHGHLRVLFLRRLSPAFLQPSIGSICSFVNAFIIKSRIAVVNPALYFL